MILFISFLMSVFSSATTKVKCEASYDELGITRQKISNLHDFYFCFGYHHARDRAWQMDYFRRVAQGRNAEIYGFSSLKSDLMMRLLNLPSLAGRLYQELPEETKQWLRAYAAGANQGFLLGKKAREFQDKGYEPEEWAPEDSLLVLVLQSFDQTRKTFFKDFEEEKFKENWKEKTEEYFNEDDVPWLNTILKKGEYEKSATRLIKTVYHPPVSTPMWGEFPSVFGAESGSNNWVVSKEKSKNGYAMLANDPHLDLKTPLFWYWINLQTPQVNLLGASLPGVPFVVSGTNGLVAWGLTNAYINTADSVFIKNYPEQDLVSFRPTVYVKVGPFKLPFFFKSFEKTRDGDVVLPLELQNEDKLFLRWTGFGLKANHLTEMFNLIEVKNVSEMDEKLKKVGLPAWNFVFADSAGDIGYRLVGEAFREKQKNPYGISNEEWSEFKKKPLLDPMERPSLLKPKRNYIYTANNRHWPLDSAHYGGRGYSHSFRGFRIDELLKDGPHDFASFKKIQCDRQAVDARFFVPKLNALIDIAEFKNWDFEAADFSTAPSLYRRLMDLMMDKWQVNEYALYRLLDGLDKQQLKELTALYKLAKDQVNGQVWKDFHIVPFKHLSQNEDWKFSPEIPGIGDTHSVDPGTSKWDDNQKKYQQFSGASMRMIIIMGQRPEIYLSLPGKNRHYTEEISSQAPWPQWRACEFTKVTWFQD